MAFMGIPFLAISLFFQCASIRLAFYYRADDTPFWTCQGLMLIDQNKLAYPESSAN